MPMRFIGDRAFSTRAWFSLSVPGWFSRDLEEAAGGTPATVTLLAPVPAQSRAPLASLAAGAALTSPGSHAYSRVLGSPAAGATLVLPGARAYSFRPSQSLAVGVAPTAPGSRALSFSPPQALAVGVVLTLSVARAWSFSSGAAVSAGVTLALPSARAYSYLAQHAVSTGGGGDQLILVPGAISYSFAPPAVAEGDSWEWTNPATDSYGKRAWFRHRREPGPQRFWRK